MSVTDLKMHFFDAANVEFNQKSWGFKPAAAFEAKNDLSGVAFYYHFPEKTVNARTSGYGLFFEQYLFERYSSSVFACYEDPKENGLKIVKTSDLNPDLMSAMHNDWAALKALNPQLEKAQVDMNDPLNMFDALLGVANFVNVDDLNFFLTNRQAEKSVDVNSYAGKIPGYASLYNEVAQLAKGKYIGWIPAPETLQKIKTALTPS